MQLNNVNILVDGYNLELPQGTGIKTYGISLVQALNILGANVNILFSKYLKNHKNIAISESLFFDSQPEEFGKLDKIKLTLEFLMRINYQAEKLNITDRVIRDKRDIVTGELLDYAGTFNAPRCYEVANFLFKKLEICPILKTKQKLDIFHATYPLPITLKNTKKITTIHDLIPLKLPYLTLDNKKFFYNLVKTSLQSSDVIITVSENTKQDLLSIFDCKPEKIFVTYQPIAIKSYLLETNKLSNILSRYNLENKKYLLFVGAIEPKKNLSRIMDAYSLLSPELPLIVVGKKGWLWEGEIGKLEGSLASKAQNKIRFLDYVTAQDLQYLYQGAYCFLFPSLYEGFGLPPLEAMSYGCPVITSNVSSLPEICGDAALYVDPYKVDDIAEKLDLLLSDNHLWTQLFKAGQERAKLFSMENYVVKLFEAYKKAIE